MCFNTEPKLRTVIWELAGSSVPKWLAEDLRKVASDLRSGALRGTIVLLTTHGVVVGVGGWPHPRIRHS